MWPFKSRNSQAREVTELRDELVRLKTDFNALARDVLDLNQSVDRWMRRDRTRAAREQDAERTPSGSKDAPVPPPGLRGVRLRRWMRSQGAQGVLGVAVHDDEPNENGGSGGVHP